MYVFVFLSSILNPKPAASFPTHLSSHHQQHSSLDQQGEGLVVGSILAVAAHGAPCGCPGDEEEEQGAAAAVEHNTQKEGLVEVLVALSGPVECWLPQTPRGAHVLSGRVVVRGCDKGMEQASLMFWAMWPGV